MVKVAYLKNPSAGVNYHRLESPLGLLASEQMPVTETDIYIMGQHNFDVLIFNRIPYQPYSNFVKLKQQGVKIIFDLDDYWIIPEWHGMFSPQYEKEYWQEIIKYLRLADVVWVSTPYLQGLIADMMIDSVLIPNALDYNDPQFQRADFKRDRLQCGWVGVGNHHMDFKVIENPFKQHSLKVDMVLAGVHELSEYWRYLAQVISGGKYKSVKFVKDLDVYNYGVLYNELDMVLLPSYNDTYTLCKSNLKLLEAGAHSLPVITNGGIFKEVNNKIGIRCESERDWIKGVKRLTESKRMRAELGQALNEYTKTKYDINKINQIRLQTIND